MRKTTILLTACAFLLAGAATTTPGAPRNPRRNSPDQEHPKRPEGKGFGLAAPNLVDNPFFQRAAEVPPVPPESYERNLPERVGRFARKEMKGRTRWFGPAGTSEVLATYADGEGHGIRVKLLDPGGLPREMDPKWRPIPAPGERQNIAGTIRERIEIGGFPGVAEYRMGERGGRIELLLEPRVRLEVNSADVRPADLREFLAALPLREIAALAPEPTPDFSDLLPGKKQQENAAGDSAN